MSWEMIAVLILIITMLTALVMEVARPGLIIFSVLVILLVSGILTPNEAFSGFANEGMLTVALLFIVAGAVQQSGLIDHMMEKWLNKSRTELGSKVRFFIPIAMLSAFLNNTPIVVTFTPIIKKWCEKRGISPSKYLIPLSYVTILGGTITLIGTSTNIVVHGMMIAYGLEGMTLFTLTVVGIPITIVGLIYIIVFGNRLLPNHPGLSPREHEEAASLDSMMAVHMNGLPRKGTKKIWQRSMFNGWFSLIIFIVMIFIVSIGWLSMLKAMSLAVIILFLSHMIKAEDAQKHMQFQVLLIIASSLGIGVAMTKTGLAQWIAQGLMAVGEPMGLFAILTLLYLLTTAFTEFITNSAAAVLMLPIGLELAHTLQLEPMGFAVIVAIAASASFITPIGYQTNLIVYGPGRYKFIDFVKIGTPLTFIVMITALTVIYNFFF